MVGWELEFRGNKKEFRVEKCTSSVVFEFSQCWTQLLDWLLQVSFMLRKLLYCFLKQRVFRANPWCKGGRNLGNKTKVNTTQILPLHLALPITQTFPQEWGRRRGLTSVSTTASQGIRRGQFQRETVWLQLLLPSSKWPAVVKLSFVLAVSVFKVTPNKYTIYFGDSPSTNTTPSVLGHRWGILQTPLPGLPCPLASFF